MVSTIVKHVLVVFYFMRFDPRSALKIRSTSVPRPGRRPKCSVDLWSFCRHASNRRGPRQQMHHAICWEPHNL